MSNLEIQYNNYLKSNPTPILTYDEWFNKVWEPKISDDFQIGPDGAYEYEDDLSDWDATLLDGLEDNQFTDAVKSLINHLSRIQYTNGDIGDLGNEIGEALSEIYPDITKQDINEFMFGIEHGIDLSIMSKIKIDNERDTN